MATTVVQGNVATITVAAVSQAPQVGAQITVGSSLAVQCNGGVTPTVLATQGVTLQADPTNTGTVYVGVTNAVGATLCIAALTASSTILIPITDPSLLFVKASIAGQKVNQSWV